MNTGDRDFRIASIGEADVFLGELSKIADRGNPRRRGDQLRHTQCVWGPIEMLGTAYSIGRNTPVRGYTKDPKFSIGQNVYAAASAAGLNFTDTSRDTPGSCMVTP